MEPTRLQLAPSQISLTRRFSGERSSYERTSGAFEMFQNHRALPRHDADLSNNKPHAHDANDTALPLKEWMKSRSFLSLNKTQLAKHLGKAVAFMTAGLLLHRLPAAKSSFTLLTSDWKAWARIALGIMTVGEVNKGLNIKMPPMLNALESVWAITPLTMGFNKKILPQLAVMSAVVPGVVGLSNLINGQVADRLHERWGIPTWVPKIMVSVASIGLGLKVYPKLFNGLSKTGVLGQAAKEEAMAQSNRMMLGTGAVVCARGCCSSVVCMSEIGEFVGGFTGNAKAKNTTEQHTHEGRS